MQSLLALPRHRSAGVLGEPHLTGNDSCRQEALCGVKAAVLQGDRPACFEANTLSPFFPLQNAFHAASQAYHGLLRQPDAYALRFFHGTLRRASTRSMSTEILQGCNLYATMNTPDAELGNKSKDASVLPHRCAACCASKKRYVHGLGLVPSSHSVICCLVFA